MKKRVSYNDRACAFNYDTLMCKGVYLSLDKTKFKANKVNFNLEANLLEKNYWVSKIEDNTIISYLHEGTKMQFLIVSNANKKDCPIDLLPILEYGYIMNQTKTLNDLMDYELNK